MAGCNFCNDHADNIFQFRLLSDWTLGWGSTITKDNVDYKKMGVFIDRGWLRLVDLDDCQCMDHGQRVKLKSCPFCGIKFEHDNL